MEICSSWSKANRKYWSLENCVSLIGDKNANPVVLAGHRQRTVTEANYLRLKISTKNLMNTELYDRIK